MFTLVDITADQVKSLIANLQKEHTSVTSNDPNTYIIDGHSILASAVYEPENGKLSVAITHKPWYISESQIEDGLQKALEIKS